MIGAEESFLELLRSLPIPCWLLGSIIILSAGLGPVPATAVHEFTAHRMQHFDMYGVRYGKSARIIEIYIKIFEQDYQRCLLQTIKVSTSK